MRREFLINIIFLVGVNLLIKPFYTFFVETEVQNRVGPEEYGVYFAIFNFTYLLRIVQDLGLQSYAGQYVPKYPQEITRFLEDTIGLRVLFGCCYFIIVAIIAIAFGYKSSVLVLIALVAINHFLTEFVAYFRAIIAALGHYRWNTFLSVLEKVVMIGGLAYLLFGYSNQSDFTIQWFVLGRMLSFLIAFVVGLLLLFWLGYKIKLRLNRKRAISLIKKTYPFALVILLMSMYNRIDAIMLERLLDDNGLQAGVYAAAYRLFHAAITLGSLFSMLLLPMFANLLINDRNELIRLLSMSMSWLLTSAILVALSVWMIGDDIMSLLYRSDAELYGTTTLITLMVSFIAVGVIYIMGSLLTANGQLKEMNTLFIVGIIANVGINLWLIPDMGAQGAAIATLVTQAVIAIGEVILVARIIHISLPLLYYLRLGGFAMLASSIFYVINVYFASLFSSWSLVVALVVSLMIALLLKTIDIVQMRRLLVDRSISKEVDE